MLSQRRTQMDGWTNRDLRRGLSDKRFFNSILFSMKLGFYSEEFIIFAVHQLESCLPAGMGGIGRPASAGRQARWIQNPNVNLTSLV